MKKMKMLISSDTEPHWPNHGGARWGKPGGTTNAERCKEYYRRKKEREKERKLNFQKHLDAGE